MNRLEEISERIVRLRSGLPKLIELEPILLNNFADIACLLELVKSYESQLKRIVEQDDHDLDAPIAREALTQGRKIKGES